MPKAYFFSNRQVCHWLNSFGKIQLKEALEIFFSKKIAVNRFSIVGLLIVATLLEGIGLAAILPVLVMAGGEVTEKSPRYLR